MDDDELEAEDGEATGRGIQPEGPKHVRGKRRAPPLLEGSVSDPVTVEAIAKWLERHARLYPPFDNVHPFLQKRIEELRNGDWRLTTHKLRRTVKALDAEKKAEPAKRARTTRAGPRPAPQPPSAPRPTAAPRSSRPRR